MNESDAFSDDSMHRMRLVEAYDKIPDAEKANFVRMVEQYADLIDDGRHVSAWVIRLLYGKVSP